MSSATPAPELFLNRELALLAFNRRVLAQAANAATPLLERLRFLCIVSNNLDEFFEIRVAGLHAEIEAGARAVGPERIPVQEVYRRVAQEAQELVAAQYRLYNEDIRPALECEGIRILQAADLASAQLAWAKAYFTREVMPVLTPIGLDPAHPFPRVLNKSLNFAVELEGKDAFGRDSGIAIVPAPRVLPRLIELPAELAQTPGGRDFASLGAIMQAHMAELFSGMKVLGCYQFRLTRNSDLFVDEEEVKDLRAALRGELPHRQFGDEVRLEISANCPQPIAEFLTTQCKLDTADVYRVDGPVNLVRLMSVPDSVNRPDLKFPPFRAGWPDKLAGAANLFDAVRAGDVLLYHPFQSFEPVIAFLEQAARDPAVVAIKQTVYRTGSESVLMESLMHAARSGKEVTVVLELLARFDEEANINWAQRLEDAGAHVVYGVVGYKTHAKMMMVVRREAAGLKRYVHLGTGNYHARTAKLYTDFGLFTCNDKLAGDVSEVFMQLTGLGRAGKLQHLWLAPFTLHRNMLRAIRAETTHAQAGRRARIIAKMNALLEPEVIAALYDASRAGVQIDLIVRGVCALRPGVPGVSDNIRVRSIVGRFLEHSRVFYFLNDGRDEVYLSSADWMGRNFFGRVEVCFPILDAQLKQRVIDEGLTPYLECEAQCWHMDQHGGYQLGAGGESVPGAQQTLLTRLASNNAN
ncbi:MAG: polyphosphate kinase 1 [Betaproteobacteria bacterium]|nr:polyphosphate kinase 1 [Betaproteobacteria bacterium]